MRYIAVLNKSKKISNNDVKIMTQACYQQLERHAAVAWGRTAFPVIFHADETTIPAEAERIVIFDTPDDADALGYHTETPDGKIYGKVFVNPVLKANGTVMTGSNSVSAVLSHEVLEQMIDPDINLWAEGNGKLYSVEVCDPVENDSYDMVVNGKTVAVSNFVFPEWFDKENRPNARFDQLGKLKKPFTMTTGGYMVIRDKKGEHEIFAKLYPKWKKAGKKHAASRTARKRTKM